MFLSESLRSTLHNPLLNPRVVTLVITVAGALLVRSGVFNSRKGKLLSKGLDLLLAGNPVEAERCYRTALSSSARIPNPDRVRLLVCLGDALFDQGRFDEAKQYLEQALQLGDPTGSCQGSMCDVLLALKAPEQAIAMADEALQLMTRAAFASAFGESWAAISKDLYEAKTLARKAQALLMLDKQPEAQKDLDRALSILDATKPQLESVRPQTSATGSLILGDRLRRMKELTISDTYWAIGLALLAMGDKRRAIEQFVVVRDTDRMGKYRNLAQKELNSLGYTGTPVPGLA